MLSDSIESAIRAIVANLIWSPPYEDYTARQRRVDSAVKDILALVARRGRDEATANESNCHPKAKGPIGD